MSLPAFLLLKYILLVKFLYYIQDENKYKRKTERVSFILGKRKPCMRILIQDFKV